MTPRSSPRMPPQIQLRNMPEPLQPVTLTAEQRARAHMIASLLLDYPDGAFHERMPQLAASVAGLPAPIEAAFTAFIEAADAAGPEQLAQDYVVTFDLKRKCCLYLSYYAAGDTRKRGTALVTFLDAYRAAGWEFDADELPDFLPAVLEFSAVSDSPVAEQLLAAHRDGIEVLRAALLAQQSPWARVVEAVCLSLPEIDEAARDRVLALVNEGPPTETVGLSFGAPTFLGNLAPFAPGGAANEEVRV
ncbi:nitrate reductase molybdenum cofactor assembly chaperone [Agromyces neolithicus]|uniref:Nitrate reductase molybdenum cofactor assembly chaperone n=1 Tax=Agromyces neolithicus TaxID=269420 RepID=A0ABN2LZY6_9MICO